MSTAFMVKYFLKKIGRYREIYRQKNSKVFLYIIINILIIKSEWRQNVWLMGLTERRTTLMYKNIICFFSCFFFIIHNIHMDKVRVGDRWNAHTHTGATMYFL